MAVARGAKGSESGHLLSPDSDLSCAGHHPFKRRGDDVSSTANHGRRGRPWRTLRARVLREEPTCYLCRVRPSDEVDHVVPLSVAPERAHDRTNLRGVCAPCNQRKGDRLGPPRYRPTRRPVPVMQAYCPPHQRMCDGGPHSRAW